MTETALRIPLITEAQRNTGEVRAMFAAMDGVSKLNNENNHALNTLAQHPALATPYLAFNKHLLTTTTLPLRLRQIAILRVGWLQHSRYIWTSHVGVSLRRGLEPEMFEPIKLGAGSEYWSHPERAVLRAVEQLRDRSDLDDATWAELSSHLDQRQIMDLLFTVGTYMLLALTYNAIRMQLEPELLEFAQQYGSPD
ncbi:MAG: pcaC [Hydrocarboniphaga sp.]|uniref:carboxymuconolactone decarboxylase family protein n=1 Tax=Hydrocarboniphaga sp. TaxID=2033016 RepID=UPI002627206A|nr:carboxymuconolactone decarboxylase family protein [Hydrocarboniphaga sp.]MDB5968614.1 pcaC [Hydrocarboniphaga sp.]